MQLSKQTSMFQKISSILSLSLLVTLFSEGKTRLSVHSYLKQSDKFTVSLQKWQLRKSPLYNKLQQDLICRPNNVYKSPILTRCFILIFTPDGWQPITLAPLYDCSTHASILMSTFCSCSVT